MGEACDDGNTTDGDGCQASCGLPTCGDGIVDRDEVCDDRNAVDEDGCSATCMSDETCGNSIVDASEGESCDDGNVVDADGCSATCMSDETCGNGATDTAAGEICDDSNTDDGDGCSANCASTEACGNGVIDVAVGEICDDSNTVDGDGCSANCRSDETCSNGVADTAVGEVCDDGNLVDGDGCAGSCMSDETCSNGIVDAAAGEECDDGNISNGDGCDGMCAVGTCAQVINTANEDVVDVNWLDNCVNAVGQNVTVTLRDDAGTIVYQESGTKNGDWTSYNHVTSTSVPGGQHDKVEHDRIITLGNGDLLMIAGKNASNAGCGGSMGNGYGLVIHAPISGAYYDTIKVLVQPYRHTVDRTSPRDFMGWSPSHEVSFNNGDVMHSCFPPLSAGPGLASLLGSVELTVK